MSKKNLTTRIIFALAVLGFFLPAFFLAKYAGTPGRIISALIYISAGMLGIYEIITKLKFTKLTGIIISLVVPLTFLLPYDEFKLLGENGGLPYVADYAHAAIGNWQPWVVIILISFIPSVIDTKKKVDYDALTRQAILTLTMILMSFLPKMIWAYNIDGIETMAYFAGIAIVSDTFAFFGGALFGKKWFNGKKMAPKISPKKTWAGFIVGFTFSVIFSILMGYYVGIFDFFKYPLLASVLVGISLSIISPLGDLMFSLIKRRMNIKDFSNLIPGHGGLADRMDAMALVVMVGSLILLI